MTIKRYIPLKLHILLTETQKQLAIGEVADGEKHKMILVARRIERKSDH